MFFVQLRIAIKSDSKLCKAFLGWGRCIPFKDVVQSIEGRLNQMRLTISKIQDDMAKKYGPRSDK
jgi:hypothetical protein